jgi:peptidoglycan/LPS O-acetylase OafA/YrhL
VLPRLVSEQALGLQDGAGQAWLWTYTLNIGLALGLIANPVTWLSHFWTLAIEEQYYLVWPGLVKVMSARSLLRLCGAVVVAALAMRIAWIALGYGPEGAYRFTLTRADSLAIGGAVAVLIRDNAWRDTLLRLAPAGLIAGLGAIALLFLSVPRFYPTESTVVTIGHSAIAFASACLVVVALRHGSRGWLAGRPLRTLGKYSYGIYVWHFPLQRILLGWYNAPEAVPSRTVGDALIFITAGLAGSVLLGWISYRLIERPFLRLKRFFAYAKACSIEPRTPAEPVLASSGR